jgi:hypothetical protein
MVPIIVLIILAASTFATWRAAKLSRARSAELVQGSADIRQFTSAARLLISDRTVPASVVEFVVLLSKEVGHARLAVWSTRQILSGRLFDETNPKNSELSRNIDLLNEEQRQALAQCIVYGLLSSAAASPFLASYLHRAIEFGLFEAHTRRVADPEKTRAIIVEFNQKKRRSGRRIFGAAHI